MKDTPDPFIAQLQEEFIRESEEGAIGITMETAQLLIADTVRKTKEECVRIAGTVALEFKNTKEETDQDWFYGKGYDDCRNDILTALTPNPDTHHE